MSAFADIGQGTGLATSSGARPFLVVITTGVMAHADAGVDFSGTDWSWMESWVFLGILAASLVASLLGMAWLRAVLPARNGDRG